MRLLVLAALLAFGGRRDSAIADTARTDEAAEARAWQVHGALVDWTGKVDTKASFVLTLVSALLTGAVTLFGDGRPLADIDGTWTRRLVVVGITLLAAAILCSVTVVAPRLRLLAIRDEASSNFVYFGHLRKWQPRDLEEALAHGKPLRVLSRQLVVMSKIAWLKHVLVAVACWLAVVGVFLIATGVAINTGVLG